MTREEAIKEINKVFEPAFANYIIIALTEGVTASDFAENKPKTGHWIKQTLSVKPFGEDTVLCDQCAFMTDKDSDYRYCPNCGAKMARK